MATQAQKEAFWAQALKQNPDAFNEQQTGDIFRSIAANEEQKRTTPWDPQSVTRNWEGYQAQLDPNTLQGALIGEDVAYRPSHNTPTRASRTDEYTNRQLSAIGRDNVYDPSRGFVDIGVPYAFTLTPDGQVIPAGQSGANEGDVLYRVGTGGNVGSYGAPVIDQKVSGPDGWKGVLASPVVSIGAGLLTGSLLAKPLLVASYGAPALASTALAVPALRDASGITQHGSDWLAAGASVATGAYGADWAKGLADTLELPKAAAEALVGVGLGTIATGGDVGAALQNYAVSQGMEWGAKQLKAFEDWIEGGVGAGLQEYVDAGQLKPPTNTDMDILADSTSDLLPDELGDLSAFEVGGTLANNAAGTPEFSTLEEMDAFYAQFPEASYNAPTNELSTDVPLEGQIIRNADGTITGDYDPSGNTNITEGMNLGTMYDNSGGNTLERANTELIRSQAVTDDGMVWTPQELDYGYWTDDSGQPWMVNPDGRVARATGMFDQTNDVLWTGGMTRAGNTLDPDQRAALVGQTIDWQGNPIKEAPRPVEITFDPENTVDDTRPPTKLPEKPTESDVAPSANNGGNTQLATTEQTTPAVDMTYNSETAVPSVNAPSVQRPNVTDSLATNVPASVTNAVTAVANTATEMDVNYTPIAFALAENNNFNESSLDILTDSTTETDPFAEPRHWGDGRATQGDIDAFFAGATTGNNAPTGDGLGGLSLGGSTTFTGSVGDGLNFLNTGVGSGPGNTQEPGPDDNPGEKPDGGDGGRGTGDLEGSGSGSGNGYDKVDPSLLGLFEYAKFNPRRPMGPLLYQPQRKGMFS